MEAVTGKPAGARPSREGKPWKRADLEAKAATGTPADLLRRAASLMRERAAEVPAAPWRSSVLGVTTPDGGVKIALTGITARSKYVASWHPAVALAVAVLLEGRAAEYDQLAEEGYGFTSAWFVAGEDGGEPDPFIALARAYLGETTNA
jgi:hypothetical protein